MLHPYVAKCNSNYVFLFQTLKNKKHIIQELANDVETALDISKELFKTQK